MGKALVENVLLSSLFVASILMSSSAHALKVSAVGDIMLGTDYPTSVGLAERDFFRSARPFLSGTDIRLGNLEGTLYDGPQNADGKRGGANRYLFRTPTKLVSHFREAGFNVLSLANNHSRDFGRAGLESTKRTLEAAGIGYSSKDGEVAEVEINGQSIAVIAADFYQGKRSITTPDSLYAEIRSLRARYDLVIVSVHAGAEGVAAQHTPNAREKFMGEDRGNSVAFARRAVESGADLVLMAGPHVPRGLEVHRDRLIAYSLGNFITERGISISGYAGLAPLLEVEMDDHGRFQSGMIHSFQQIRGRSVQLDPAKRAFRLMSQMSLEDFPSSAPTFDGGNRISPRNAPYDVTRGAPRSSFENERESEVNFPLR